MNKRTVATSKLQLNRAANFFQKLRANLQANPNTTALFSLTAATLALSFAAIFIKLSEVEIGPNATVFNRLWIATVALWLWREVKLIRQDSEIAVTVTGKEKGLLILVAVVSSASVICWAWSITQISIANSTLLRNLTPLFTSLGAWLIFNRRFEGQFIAGTILAICGGIALGWRDWQAGSDYLLGDGLALMAAVFYAANLLIIGSVRDKLDTTTILLWRCGFGTLLTLPVVFLTEKNLFPYSGRGWLIVFALAVICQVIGQGLLVYSLKHLSSSFVAIFLLLEPIITAIFAWIIFCENLSLYDGIVFIVILFGIYLAKSSKTSEKTENR